MKSKIKYIYYIVIVIILTCIICFFVTLKQKKAEINKKNIEVNYNYCENSYINNIKGKKFLCFGEIACYDISTYKYNPSIDTYTFDYMYERTPGEGSLIESPYDKGYISRLIFGVVFSPSKKYFHAYYKGFITTIELYNSDINSYYEKFINVYYDNNSKHIPDLNSDIDFLKNIENTYDELFIDNFSTEVTKCLPKYLKTINI